MTHSQPKRSLLDLSSPRYLLDALGGHLPPAADPNFDCLMADFPTVNSVSGCESRGAPVGGAGCSHVFGGLLTGRLRFRRRETGTAIRELPAAPRCSQAQPWKVPGSLDAARERAADGLRPEWPPRPKPTLGSAAWWSHTTGFIVRRLHSPSWSTGRRGARGGGEHAYWGEKAVPQPWQREAQHSAALRSGDLTCSLSAVLSPPVMSLQSQWPSLGFCPASGLHHLLSIARARRGSPVGKPPLPPLAR